MDHHDGSVAAVAARVRSFYARKAPFHLYHGSTNSTRPSKRQRDTVVDVSALSHVLSIDTQAKVVWVEPNVPMDDLVAATLPCGLVPPVVMEFPGITVGGGFAGTGCESSSFRYGYFDRIVNSIEIVLGNGEVVKASKTQNTDLFYGAACAFGTLGVVTLLEVQLVEASLHVEVTYHPMTTFKDALAKIKEATVDESNEFLEGIMFDRDRTLVCSGRRHSPGPRDRIQSFSRATDPWYYLHAESKMSQHAEKQQKDFVPLVDYLFRYDRGAFWTGRWAYRYFLVPFVWFFRWLLDYFMHTRVMYHALHESGYSHTWIIQDAVIPYDKAEEFIDYVDKAFGCYPLWLCPIKQRGRDPESRWGLLAQKPEPGAPDMMLNVGIYTGVASRSYQHFTTMNRDLERKIYELRGEKWLYAHTFYTEGEFWKLLDRGEYDSLREKYHASHLPTIYEKVRMVLGIKEPSRSLISRIRGRLFMLWPFAGLYGVMKALLASDYLLPKQRLNDIHRKTQ